MTNPIIPNPVFETLPPPWQLVILDAWTASVNAAVNQLYANPTAFNATFDGTNQSIVSAVTADVQFKLVNFQTDTSYDPTTGVFTAANSGIYRFECFLEIVSTGVPASAQGYFSRNGATLAGSTDVYAFSTMGFISGPPVQGSHDTGAVTVSLNAGDTFRVRCINTGSTTVQIGIGGAPYGWFSGSQVR